MGINLTWYRNDVSYCFEIYISFFNFFLSFQGQRLQKKAIYTNDYQSVMSKCRVTLTDIKWMKATV